MKVCILGSSLFAYVLLLLTSCEKGEKSIINQSSLWDCYHEQVWDSLQIENSLLGQWDWVNNSCGGFPNNMSTSEFAGIRVVFKEGNILELIQDSVIIQTSDWHVVDGDAHLFELDLNPNIYQLNGRILICAQEVLFNQSYIDGCDNYFQKME